MIRVINSLNEMSFELPEDYAPVKDKFQLNNGQGFVNTENYLSKKDGRVISLFEIHREPKEFVKYYTSPTQKYKLEFDKVELSKKFTLKVSGLEVPTFVLRGSGEKERYILQTFIDCGDCLACFMITIENFSQNIKSLIDQNPVLQDLVFILRSVKWKDFYYIVVVVRVARRL